MSRTSKRLIRRKNKRKQKLFLTTLLIIIFLSTIFIKGESVFYAVKTSLYKNQAANIDIKINKNDDLENINLNFSNDGSCDVYLRGFVFVYYTNEDNEWTTFDNSSIKIDYGDEEFWYLGEDNYIYYKSPLLSGKSTESPMVENIEINLREGESIKNGQIYADIIMEAVQVNNFAYKYQWDMENIDLKELFENNESENIQTLEEESVINLKFE